MGLLEITVDLTSLTEHGSTLYASGTKVLKCLFYGVDMTSTNTYLALVNEPYDKHLKLAQDGGQIATLIGTTQTDHGEAPAMVPLFITSACGFRVFSNLDDDSLINITYMEVTS